MGSSPLTFTRRIVGNVVTFRIAGQLDSTNCDSVFAHVYNAVSEPSVTTIILDVRELEYINSKSIGFILDAHLRAEEAGKGLCLFGAEYAAKDALEVSGAADYVAMGKTEAEALEILNKRHP